MAILGQKWRLSFGAKISMCFFPFPALVFPKNREISGNSREVIFGNSQTGTTLHIGKLIAFNYAKFFCYNDWWKWSSNTNLNFHLSVLYYLLLSDIWFLVSNVQILFLFSPLNMNWIHIRINIDAFLQCIDVLHKS